uniref:Polyamine aminopropyltransferase n=1 Tax=Candidatus Kentrum sp. DK TaxID=2126562 RepID=A0A450S5M7_9GAMM|nr:MAG: spermidine synthase [Candidatus Kentron sp. DK]
MNESGRSGFPAGQWFTELDKAGGVGLTLRVSRMLYSRMSDFQRIEVMETEEFGRALVLYGCMMLTEKDEFMYHEMISHVALHVHPNPARVLIVGGGDGGALREVLRHRRVTAARIVEIDPQVVEVSRRFFPAVASGFGDPRTRLVYGDGAGFVANTGERFDVIISDSPDPVGTGKALFQRTFYQGAFNALRDDGIFVFQSESPAFQPDNVRNNYNNLRGVFPIVRMYLGHVPTYPGFLWSFAFCSKRYHPLLDFHPEYEPIAGLRYYNADVHRGAFALPNYVKALLDGAATRGRGAGIPGKGG